MEQIPPKLQNQIIQFQQVQQQAQSISTQRMQLDLQLKELDRSISEVEKLDDKSEIYKNVGAILMKSDPPSITVELHDKRETFDLRIKTLTKQEKKIQKRLKEMQDKIQGEIKQGNINIPNIQ